MHRDIIIRIAKPHDAPELVRLNTLFNGTRDTAGRLAARMADPQRVDTAIVAEADGRIAGFACLRVVPAVFYAAPQAELTELCVEEAHRRLGLGHGLMLCAERLARQAGAEELLVLVNVGNGPAQALYRSLGFEDRDLALSKPLSQATERTLATNCTNGSG